MALSGRVSSEMEPKRERALPEEFSVTNEEGLKSHVLLLYFVGSNMVVGAAVDDSNEQRGVSLLSHGECITVEGIMMIPSL